MSDVPRLPFGPYEGDALEAVARLDPGYLVELIRAEVGSPELRAAAARSLIAHRVAGGAARARRRLALAGLAAALIGLLIGVLTGGALTSVASGGAAPARALPLEVTVRPTDTAGARRRAAGWASRPSGAATTGATAVATTNGGSDQAAAEDQPCGRRVSGAIAAAEAAEHVGEMQAVEFEVVRTKDTGRVTFLNSHDPYDGYFYVAVFPDDYDRFPAPPAEYFAGRCLVVQGVIERYRGTPQVVLRDPTDVRVVGP